MKILIFIFAFLIFNFIIFAHEFGHFFTAKLFKIKVEEFAIGMGPRLISKKKNETVYSIRCLPVGGFCALEEETNKNPSNKISKTSFASKPMWQRFIVLISGGILNLVVGFLFTVLLCYNYGIPSTIVTEFEQNSSSFLTGLRTGDKIISINNNKTFIGKDINFILRTESSKKFVVDVMRNDLKITLKDVEFKYVQRDPIDKSYSIMDFYIQDVDKNILNLLNYSILDIYHTVSISLKSIGWLITGKISLNEMAGPIGIATQIDKIAEESIKLSLVNSLLEILRFMSIFSISVGIFNLIPFPALDGGRVLFALIEKLCGRKFKPGTENWFHTVGFYILIILMLTISYNDILRIIKRN